MRGDWDRAQARMRQRWELKQIARAVKREIFLGWLDAVFWIGIGLLIGYVVWG